MMTEYKYKVVDDNGGSCSLHPGSVFYLKYEKGARVKAPKGSLGIMVFPSIESAKDFLRYYAPSIDRIKRVLPIGRKTVPKWVARWTIGTEDIEEFYNIPAWKRPGSPDCDRPPQGTECYPGVIVVD
jgi:hypothetical protein